MTLPLSMDIAFSVLLIITICYAVILNRKLSNLHQHKKDLEKLSATFIQSTSGAEEAIKRLKDNSEKTQKNLLKAQGLRDDLNFLIDRSSTAADRLERNVREVQSQMLENKKSDDNESLELKDGNLNDTFGQRTNVSSVMKNKGFDLKKIDNESKKRQKSQAEKDLIEALRLVQ